ncbi:RidA family protein [Alcaligenes nematophilus]|uniref:RidA family protein n=1 Tax=Alcaligenes nematophilus TaxID=2994643 RepID=UPI003851357E
MQNKQAINPDNLPKLPGVVSHGIVLNKAGLVYTSGQLSWDENGHLVAGDLFAQFERAYSNIDIVLQAAGTCRSEVISETIYIVGDCTEHTAPLVQALTQARPAGSIPPTSTLVGVQSLFAEGFLVEVQVVATI